jgi:hypothetical protein
MTGTNPHIADHLFQQSKSVTNKCNPKAAT